MKRISMEAKSSGVFLQVDNIEKGRLAGTFYLYTVLLCFCGMVCFPEKVKIE